MDAKAHHRAKNNVARSWSLISSIYIVRLISFIVLEIIMCLLYSARAGGILLQRSLTLPRGLLQRGRGSRGIVLSQDCGGRNSGECGVEAQVVSVELIMVAWEQSMVDLCVLWPLIKYLALGEFLDSAP